MILFRRAPEQWPHILERISAPGYPRNKAWRFLPDACRRFEAEGDADQTDSRMTDTGYMAKMAARYLRAVCAEVTPLRGGMTARLRHLWGLDGLEYPLLGLPVRRELYDPATGEVVMDERTGYPKRNPAWKAKARVDHRHHALDALVLACATRGMMQHMARADRLGLIVWGELPSAYEFNDRAVEASARELTRFVERDYNHPCIVTWVPVNESWGVRQILENTQQQDYCRMLTYLLRALDPVRLISSNDGWEQVNETDICAVHDYALFPSTVGKYDDMEALCDGYAESRYLFAAGNEYQGQPVILTEYGGIAFEKEEKGWGYYGKVKNEEEFLERLQPITEFLIRSGKFSGFCYTQLTDVMQEVNGLLCEDRTPKVPAEKLKEIFGAPVFA